MNPNDIITQAQSKFQQAADHFQNDLKSLRTGRASATMLDGIMAEAYGSPMPLNQLATVTAPEAQLLQISPFDAANLQSIVTAIRNNQSLGMNPTDDGRVIRIPIPALTEERRKEIAKQIGQKQEDAMVRLRGARHDALDAVSKAKKDKDIGEDDAKRLEKQIEDALAKSRAGLEAAAAIKEREVLSL